MTFDRYLAVLYPLKSIEYRTTKIAFITNVVIWIASFTLNLPYYLYYNERSYGSGDASDVAANSTSTESSTASTITPMLPLVELKYCVATFPSLRFEIVLTLYTVMISYVLPLIVIIFCYMRMIVNIYTKSSEFELSKNYSTRKNETKTGMSINNDREVGRSTIISHKVSSRLF
jgi:hypothetical protein